MFDGKKSLLIIGIVVKFELKGKNAPLKPLTFNLEKECYMYKNEPTAETAPSDAVPYDPSVSPLAEADANQWSDYVTNLRDGGDRWWFYIRCGPTQDYSVLKSQVSSLRQVGICGNWALYYMVL
jgi:hypothetical protein